MMPPNAGAAQSADRRGLGRPGRFEVLDAETGQAVPVLHHDGADSWIAWQPRATLCGGRPG
ncbi:MAG: hypothetical protein M0Z47_00975, partial [Actinomycetota bacterium]|nr:hypothetical protein [Actinomycetota bacterium]